MTPPSLVIDLYNRLAGARLSSNLPDVRDQACTFVQTFELEDLEITFLWIQREISAGRNGFNAMSLTWRGLFGRVGAGDEWLNFHDRLAKARLAERKGWRPKLSTRPQSEAPALTVLPKPEEPPVDETIRQQGVEQLRAWRMGGLAS